MQARLRAALLVALLTMAVGMVGIVYPDALTAARRSYFATPGRLYAAGALRLVMGLVVVLAAPDSRWPRILRVLGVVLSLQALSAILMGPEHARTILEWESRHTALLRAGACVALITAGFVAFAISMRSRGEETHVT